MTGFKVPTCVCGHPQGDHVSAGGGFVVTAPAGKCLRCTCLKYEERPHERP